ncbi:hypothetical protein RvY_05221 [Ramazzottius varieornatus]|uniref:UBA domain-containing protein n=1 Tax=Ramazzottius varieornatus TaxID=947166 RepID=A0A1D1UXY3_RAMVA|nr:hypothetical protein RvY_05221 [Ramazzottius varieornatus]
MRLTFTTANEQMVTMELGDDMELENVKALCEFDLGIPAKSMVLSANGKQLKDDRMTLGACGLRDGDIVLVQNNATSQPSRSAGGPSPAKLPKIDFSSIVVPGTSSGASTSRPSSSNNAGMTSRFTPLQLGKAQHLADMIRQGSERDPETIERFKKEHPKVVEAALKGDLVTVAEHIKTQHDEMIRKQRILIEQPDSAEAQQLMLEAIRQQQIQDNFEHAMEHAPENFASVHMLYVNCSVNGKQMKAFVDSGAQVSIISKEFAELCNVGHLIDTRFQGVAVGVGTQNIVGKIHACQMSIGGAFFTVSFNVLEANNMQILLGLDMMKRHQMCIDLKRNVLVIGTTNAEAPFLSESELPEKGGKNGMVYEPNETEIQVLIGMGFTRDAARTALSKHNGMVDAAAADLAGSQGSTASTGTPK